MKVLIVSCFVAAALPVAAQAQNREAGWEFGADVIYQDASNVSFNGGSQVDFHDDWGVDLAFAYRFNERLELAFGLDWQELSYDADFVSATNPALGFRIGGDMEAFTPRIGVNFNFLPGSITPYVTGSVGWTFVDTNIPNGRVQVGCWWDPWWGQICTPYQSTKSPTNLRMTSASVCVGISRAASRCAPPTRSIGGTTARHRARLISIS
jgi:Outer membrane protein beta-barrel domain